MWRQTLWTDIKTDVMEEGTKAFVKEVKALPKNVRDEDCFKVRGKATGCSTSEHLVLWMVTLMHKCFSLWALRCSFDTVCSTSLSLAAVEALAKCF